MMMTASLLLAADVVTRVSLLLAGAAVATRALARCSAATRHQVWVLALAGALAMPVVVATGPRWALAVLPAPAGSAPERSHASASATVEPVAVPVMPTSHEYGPSPRPASTSSPSMTVRPAAAAAAVWIAGVLLVLVRLGFGAARIWWIARRARPAAAWTPLAERLVRSLRLDRRVTFLSGGRDEMPMAWGLLRPRVLLPASAEDWPESRLKVVLMHELAHVKRRDSVTQLVAHLTCAAYWFNPLVWLAASRLRTERERACDDFVLAAGTRGSDYADHLLDIARVLRTRGCATWSVVTMAHRSQLEGRLMAILDPALPRRSATRGSIATSTALAVACTVALAGVRPVAKTADGKAVTAAPSVDSTAPTTTDTSVRIAASQEPRAQAARLGLERLQAPMPMPIPMPTPTPAPVPTTPMQWVIPPDAFPIADIDIDVPDVGALWHDALASFQASAAQGGAQRSDGSVDPKVVSALTEALKDEDKEVRQHALRALVQMRAPLPADTFATLLRDDDPDVRRQAVLALGRLRDPQYIDALTTALTDANADVRQQAAFAMGQLRDARAVAPLTSALTDADPDVRKQAAFALGQLRDRRAIDGLIAALKDANADVRRQAAFALGQIR